MRYKSEIYEVVHQDAMANFEVGAISEAEMREFDEMCLATESKADEETVAMERITA
ncbi:MAG: XRE family transcriptional regulator [Treponema sp.]|nr:XRE family transcriptional regulator [Treponema sp.]